MQPAQIVDLWLEDLQVAASTNPHTHAISYFDSSISCQDMLEKGRGHIECRAFQ